MRSLRMLSLVERVYRTISRFSLLPPGARVLVALSGGADSTALACLLVELSRRGGFSVVGAAHLNHHLRGEAANEDEAFSASLAGALGLDWLSGHEDVRAAARSAGTSLEDAARRERYRFLDRAAEAFTATHVAVGHTRDDRAETFLLQLLRGAGPRGLGSMRPMRPLAPGGRVALVRPLLETGHAELVAWLRERGQTFREDLSNRDVRFLRNRVRHELIPFLERRFSPGVTRVLGRAASIADSDAEYLDRVARDAYGRLTNRAGDGVELDRAGLAAEADAVARRVLLLALGNLVPSRFVGFMEGERLVDLATGRSNGPIALPGVIADVAGGVLRLRPGGWRGRAAAGMNNSRFPLSTPGEIRVPGTGWTVSCCLRPWNGEGATRWSELAGREAIVDASRARGLSVRFRRAGDSFRPLGLGGHKKLQDFFVDRKVPRAERDRVPLVVDAEDRIVWVGGHAIDDSFRVGPDTDAVVILTLRGESA